MEISNLTDKEFTVRVIKMFAKLGRRLDEQCELQQRDRKYQNIPKSQSERTSSTELKNTIY